MVVHARSSRATSTPLLPGKTKSKTTASGDQVAARIRACSPGPCCRHLVAGTAKRRLERTKDLRLVVDDENALPAQTWPSTIAAESGKASMNDAPSPLRDSAQMRPPLTSANPRAIANPSPAPWRTSPRGQPLERLEHTRQIV